MNTRCLCGHTRDWHHYVDPARCVVTACGCKAFRTVAAPSVLQAVPSLGETWAAPVAVTLTRDFYEDDEPSEQVRAAFERAEKKVTTRPGCTDTHSVATGYGMLRCDLRHPHPGLHHHDGTHRIIWRADEVGK